MDLFDGVLGHLSHLGADEETPHAPYVLSRPSPYLEGGGIGNTASKATNRNVSLDGLNVPPMLRYGGAERAEGRSPAVLRGSIPRRHTKNLLRLSLKHFWVIVFLYKALC